MRIEKEFTKEYEKMIEDAKTDGFKLKIGKYGLVRVGRDKSLILCTRRRDVLSCKRCIVEKDKLKDFYKSLREIKKIHENVKDFLFLVLCYHSICEAYFNLILSYFITKQKIDSKDASLFGNLFLNKMTFEQKRQSFNKILEDSEKLKLYIKELNEMRNKLVHDYFLKKLSKIKVKINNKPVKINFKSKKSVSEVRKELFEFFYGYIAPRLHFIYIELSKEIKS